MGSMSKFDAVVKVRQTLADVGIDPFGVLIERVLSPTEGLIQGRPTILAGTNNYLGLTFDPRCVAAGCEALTKEGTGTTGSRMANGTYVGHRQLEQELAEFYGKRHAVVFSTGYQANLGTISALAGADDVVLVDADCHASIYDGCRLGGAKVIRFRHNDPTDLAKRLRRLGDAAGDALILVEGIYSMLGDRAPLKAFVEVKREFGSRLLVDEAHSLGVDGDGGRGVAEAAGVLDDVDFVVGTFSKSLGGVGGFCVSDSEQMELLPYASRPYIFTASPTPATIASVRAALPLLADGHALRRQLRENAERLHAGLTALGYTLGAPVSQVVAVVLDDRTTALRFWAGLLERGVYVNLMVPPATPNNESLVRCSVSAAHTPAQIDAICAAFAALRDTL